MLLVELQPSNSYSRLLSLQPFHGTNLEDLTRKKSSWTPSTQWATGTERANMLRNV